MGDLAGSAMDLLSGILRRWFDFLPGVGLGLLGLLGVAVPVPLTVAVLAIGLGWAVLMTYHELSANTKSSLYLGTLSFEGPGYGLVDFNPATGEVRLQPYVTFLNRAKVKLDYQVESFTIRIGNIEVPPPDQVNTGGGISSGAPTNYYGGFSEPIKVGAVGVPIVMDYVAIFGPTAFPKTRIRVSRGIEQLVSVAVVDGRLIVQFMAYLVRHESEISLRSVPRTPKAPPR